MLHPKCANWLERQSILAGGPATLSKLPSRYPIPVAPSVLVDSDGPYVWCADGERYIDVVAGLGPILLGHNDYAVALAVKTQAETLACSTLSTPLECEVAEMLVDIIPGAEQVRFASNGKDVTEAAVKLARHVTGNDCVIFCGYHGGFGDYLITTDKNGGLLGVLGGYNYQVPWRDFEAIEHVLQNELLYPGKPQIAAIMLEVPPERMEVQREETAAILQQYADIAHAHGGVFILDEIVTGLRYGLQGAQGYYDIQADLVTMSKALGNGYPVAALLGPRDLMRGFDGGKVFLSTTFGASPIGLAAAKATLLEIQKPRVFENLVERGRSVQVCMRDQFLDEGIPATVRGNYARWVVDFHSAAGFPTGDELRTLWLQEFAKRGVLAGVPWFSMACWDSDVERQLCRAIKEVCQVVGSVVRETTSIKEVLEVPVVGEVFQRYERAS